MIISVFDRVENIVGKGEIACTSNFSFSNNVLKRLLSQTRQKVSLCGDVLTFSVPIKSLFLCGGENNVGKGEIACTRNSPNVFKRLLSQNCQKVSLCSDVLTFSVPLKILSCRLLRNVYLAESVEQD